MGDHSIIFSVFIIFTGAAIFSTLALFTRQSMLVAYMLLGLLIGPWGLKIIVNPEIIQHISDVGIIFLLFLLGLNLQPQRLVNILKKVTSITVFSSLIFALVGFAVGSAFGFSLSENFVIAAAMMFSSTIIGLKLLPTTVLHHQYTGEIMIGVLLLQDLLAIIVLLLLHGASMGTLNVLNFSLIIFSLPFLVAIAFVAEKYLISYLVKRFGRIREYIFLIAIAWCLTFAEGANLMGLSAEIGAFIAGVSLASNPISVYIAESLKPIRDFFLVLFFFSVGASFDLHLLPTIFLPTLVLSLLILLIKPASFYFLLRRLKEPSKTALEIGSRLGQVSEFSLLISFIAWHSALISNAAAALIQATTIISFIVSSYWVVLRYPTPVAISEKLRRD